MAWVWVFTVFGDRLSSVAISVRVSDPRSKRSTLTWRSVRSSGRVAGSLLVTRRWSLQLIDTPRASGHALPGLGSASLSGLSLIATSGHIRLTRQRYFPHKPGGLRLWDCRAGRLGSPTLRLRNLTVKQAAPVRAGGA